MLSMYIIKLKREAIATWNVAHYFHWIVVIFQRDPEHFDSLVPSFALTKLSLHLQPFMNSHFHYLIIVESATFQVLLHRPRQMIVHPVIVGF